MFTVCFLILAILIADAAKTQSNKEKSEDSSNSVQDKTNNDSSSRDFDPDLTADLVGEATRDGILYGAGTNIDKLKSALTGLDKDQIEQTKRAYKEKYGNDMEEDIRGEWRIKFNAENREQVDLLLKGDKVATKRLEATEGARKLSKHIMSGKLKKANSLLEAKSPEEVERIVAEFKALNLDKSPEEVASRLHAGEKGQESQLEELKLRSSGNRTAIAAMDLNSALESSDPEAVNSVLNVSDDQREQIVESYEQRYSKSLISEIRIKLESGPERDLSRALANGEMETADAARLRIAMGGKFDGTDEAAIDSVFEGNTAGHNAQIKARYEQIYGRSLDKDLRSELGKNELARTKSLMEKGGLSEAETLFHAVNTDDADFSKVEEVLSTRSKTEIDSILAEYENLEVNTKGQSFRKDSNSHFNNRDENKVQIYLEGEPQTMLGKAKRQLRIAEFETEQKGLGKTLVDSLTSDDEVLERNSERLGQIVNDLEAKEKLSDDQLSVSEVESIRKVTRDVKASEETYVETREATAEGAATVVAATAAVGATVVTGGIAGVAIGAALGGTSYVGVKKAVSGASYELDDGSQVARDLAKGAVEGALSVGGAKVGLKAAQNLSKINKGKIPDTTVTRSGVEGTVDGMIGGAGSEAIFGAAEADWSKGVEHVLEEIATRALAGGVLGGLGGGLAGAGIAGFGKGLEIGAKQTAIKSGESKIVVVRRSAPGENKMAAAYLENSNQVRALYEQVSQITGASPAVAAEQASKIDAFYYEGGRNSAVDAFMKENGIAPGSMVAPDVSGLAGPENAELRREWAALFRHENAHFLGAGEIEATAIQKAQLEKSLNPEAANSLEIADSDLGVLGLAGVHGGGLGRGGAKQTDTNSLAAVPARLRSLEINREVILGRGSDADIELSSLEGGNFSREHASLRLDEDGNYVVRDLGSVNGTFVLWPDGQWSRLSGEMESVVEPGGRIRLGLLEIALPAREIDLPPGQSSVVGRAGDIAIPDSEISEAISREHFTLSRSEEGVYTVEPIGGKELRFKLPNGTSGRVEQEFEVLPGAEFLLPDNYLVKIPPKPLPELRIGQEVSIGVNHPDSLGEKLPDIAGLGGTHASIKRSNEGHYIVSAGPDSAKASSEGVYVQQLDGSWRELTEPEILPSETIIRLGEEYQIKLPAGQDLPGEVEAPVPDKVGNAFERLRKAGRNIIKAIPFDQARNAAPNPDSAEGMETLLSSLARGRFYSIGRDAEIQVGALDAEVSAEHAGILVDEKGRVHIADGVTNGRGSTNGTFVKNPGEEWKRVSSEGETIEAKPGAQVRLGVNTHFQIPSKGLDTNPAIAGSDPIQPDRKTPVRQRTELRRVTMDKFIVDAVEHDGSDVLGHVDFMKSLGAEPKHFVHHEGAEFLLSDRFSIGGGREAVLAIVDNHEGQYMRVYYRSNSAGAFRGLAAKTMMLDEEGVPRTWYDKGLDENTLILPPSVSKNLAERIPINSQVSEEAGLALMFGATHYFPNMEVRRQAGFEEKLREDYSFENILSNYTGAMHSRARGGPIRPPQEVRIVDSLKRPDFSRVVDQYSVQTAYPNDVEALIYRSHDDSIEYTLYRMVENDGQEKAWFASITPTPGSDNSRINKYGNFETVIEAEELTVPAWEYEEQIPDEFRGLNHPQLGQYYDNWSYVSQLPEIQEWLRHQDRS